MVDDLINFGNFLGEKGEPFRVQMLKIAKVYVSAEGYMESAENSGVFERVGMATVDNIASKKMDNEFLNTYSVMLSIELLNDLVDYHSYSLPDQLSELKTSENISEAGLEKMQSYNSLGWLTRFTRHFDSRVRFLAWNLLKSLITPDFINQHANLIDESLENFLADSELYSIKITSLNYL